MKKLFLLLAVGIVSLACKAQITITKADMPAGGDTFRYNTVQAGASVNISATGPNHTWNFQTLVKNGDELDEYKKSINTSYAFYFANSFGLKTADSLGFGQFSLKDMYSFYKTSNTAFTAEGLGFKFNGIPLAGFYTNEDEIYTFPLKFNDRDSSPFRVSISIPALGSYVQAGMRNNFVDGWGTLITPEDSYACIRVKSVINEIDSFKVTQPFPINLGFPVKRTEYKWLSNTEKVPVLEITGTEVGNNFTPTSIRYRGKKKSGTGPGTSANEIPENSKISIYPNPASDKIIVSIANKTEMVKLFDMTGREVAVMYNTAEQGIEINTTSLTAGNYMLFVKAGGELIWEKVEIVK